MKILIWILGWLFACFILILIGVPESIVTILSMVLYFVIMISCSKASDSYSSSSNAPANTHLDNLHDDSKSFEEIAMLDMADGNMDGNFDIFNPK